MRYHKKFITIKISFLVTQVFLSSYKPNEKIGAAADRYICLV